MRKQLFISMLVIISLLLVPAHSFGSTNYYNSAGRLKYTILTNGKIVKYSYDKNGNMLSKIVTQDTQPPTAPAKLRFFFNSGPFVSITWEQSTDDYGIAKYVVYLNGAESGTTTGLTYSFDNLKAGTAYTISVKAVDLFNNYSTASSISANRDADLTPPTTPIVSIAATTTSSVTIQWTLSDDDFGVKEYICYYNSNLYTTTGTSYTFDNLTPNTTYTFHVAAKDINGNLSSEDTITVSTKAEPPVLVPDPPSCTRFGCIPIDPQPPGAS